MDLKNLTTLANPDYFSRLCPSSQHSYKPLDLKQYPATKYPLLGFQFPFLI